MSPDADLLPGAIACRQSVVAFVTHVTTKSAGGKVLTDNDLFCASNGHGYLGGQHQTAIRLNNDLDAVEVLDRIRAFFAERGRRHTLWISELVDADLARDASTRGYSTRPAMDVVGMALTHPPVRIGTDSGIRYAAVQTEDDTKTFVEILADAYGNRPGPMPRDAFTSLFGNPSSLLNPSVTALIGREGERPVAAALAHVTQDVGGVYWVATIPDGRGRGVGTTITAMAARAAFDLGARRVVLQAAPMGVEIYRRLGFDEVDRYQRFESLE